MKTLYTSLQTKKHCTSADTLSHLTNKPINIKKLLIPGKTLALIVLMLFSVAFAQGATYTWNRTTGGAQTTTTYWTPTAPTGGPPAGSDVIINSDQSAAITAVPTISLNSLSINGTCSFEGSTSPATLTITVSFSVAANETFTIGNNNRINFTINSGATGNIAGTFSIISGKTNRIITNNGDLTIASTGLINEGSGSQGSDFVLSSGATLRIGSTSGITTSGATGNIQVTGARTFNSGANYVYNGTAAQNTGTGFPTNLTGSLTINNSNGVTLVSSARTIASGGAVKLTLGAFTANTYLTMATTSNINRSEGSITGTL